MDGARIANACASLGLSLRALTVDCGIDVLSFGGTKNGLMMGERVIVFDDSLKSEARFIRKQSAQLASKMRYLSCQFTAYLTDELWLKNATHANAMAKRLADALEQVPGVRFTQRVESNQLFLTMPKQIACCKLISSISGMRKPTKYVWSLHLIQRKKISIRLSVY